ncbi:MAG: T9SS type A sorting domain-containing protein [Elusimicrobia bacterium]|nr:T9SS type A sorting domain-containing protein [Elusimicrobiota bacterium]
MAISTNPAGPVTLVSRSSTTLAVNWGLDDNIPSTAFSVLYQTAPAVNPCASLSSGIPSISTAGTNTIIANLLPGTTYLVLVCNFASPGQGCDIPIVTVTGLDGLEYGPTFVTCSTGTSAGGGGGPPPSINFDGITIAAAQDGNLWEVAKNEDNGVFTLTRWSSDGKVSETSTVLPGASDESNWTVVFDTMGATYAVGSASGPLTLGLDLIVYKVSSSGVLVSSSGFHAGVDGKSFGLDATGDIWIAGGVLGDAGGLSLWRYCVHTGSLTRTAIYSRGGSFDAAFGVKVASNNIWLAGYSMDPAHPGTLDLGIWEYDASGTRLIGGPFFRPGYLQSFPNGLEARLEVSTSSLFVAAQRTGVSGEADLAYAKFDLAGHALVERAWADAAGRTALPHGTGLDGSGNFVAGGRLKDQSGGGALALWKYSPQGQFLSAVTSSGPSGANGLVLSPDAWLAVDGTSVPFHLTSPTALAGTDIFISSFSADSTPPQTTLLVDGLAVSGSSIAIVSTDTLSFVAVDTGSGVFQTLFSLDFSSAQVYSNSFTVSAGTHTLSFHSIDVAGNQEAQRSVFLTVFSTGVFISLAFNPSSINLKANAPFEDAVIEVQGAKASVDIDSTSLKITRVNSNRLAQPLAPLPQPPGTLGDANADGIQDLSIKFDRPALVAVLPVNEQTLVTIEGRFKDGSPLLVTALLRTTSPGKVKTDRGGTVSQLSTSAQVAIPANALSQDTDITVLRLSASAPADEQPRVDAALLQQLKRQGSPFEFGPDGTQFALPATISLPYDTAGPDPHSLKIAYWNPSTKRWEPLDSTADTMRHVVGAQTTHFSVYQLVAPQGATPASTAASAPAALGADPTFVFHDLYAFPNPSRHGQSVVVRIQVGLADSVEINFHDLSGKLVGQGSFGPPKIIDDGNGKGPQYTHDYPWDVSGVGSGIYIYSITAKKGGFPAIHKLGKLGVIR